MGAHRRHIRLGAAFLTLGGAAFALIQILQGTISAFNPRPVVTVLIAVGIALAGATLGRLRQRSLQTQRFNQSLRLWPLRRIVDTDPLALGVFPARELPGQAGSPLGLPPYVPRDIDDELRAAVGAGGFVLIAGPARAGKSRAAVEAARAVLGDREVVVPEDGPSLSALADDAWSGFGASAVWWLDDLERFLDQLGGLELAVLLDRGRTVIATIRDARWEALLRAGGDDGERGRRLRAAARVLRLNRELSPGEAMRAKQLLGLDDLSAGLGEDDLSAGLGEALGVPDEGPVPPRAAPEPSPRRAPDPVALLGAAATVAVAAALALVIAADGFAPVKPPPLSNQIAAIRQRAAAAGKNTLVASPEYLHGDGQESWVFVLRPADGGSDELRVYDVVGGFLRLRFDFQPRTQGKQGAIGIDAATQESQGVIDYGLKRLRILDLFGNGEREIVADYAQLSLDSPVHLPILVSWDDLAQRYRLEPLVQSAPVAPSRFSVDPALQGAYLLRDRLAPTVLHAWAVAGYAVLADTGAASATLAIADSGTDRQGRSGLAISTYDLTESGGQVYLTLDCQGHPAGAVILGDDSDPTRVLEVAAGPDSARLPWVNEGAVDVSCTG